MTTSETTVDQADSDVYAEEDDWELEPRGPRSRSWLTILLAASALGAIAFACGIAAQKHWGTSSSRASGFTFPTGFPGAGAAGGTTRNQGPFAGLGTTGQVSYIRGTTIYITDTQGSTFRVKVPNGLQVSRTVKAPLKSVRPGETISVQGTTRSNGDISATAITVGAGSTP
jgi:hypothetical protein